jgi:hypothetical protein
VPSTHVVSILTVQVERLNEVDMRIADHSGVVKVVRTERMRQQPMSDEDVSSLGLDRREFLAGWNMGIEGILERRVQTLRVVVEVLADI